jgi:hypothetical protein
MVIPQGSSGTCVRLRQVADRRWQFFVFGLVFLFAYSTNLAAHGQGITSYWNSREKSEHVFFVGTDQQIHELYYINARWHHGSTGAPLGALEVMPRSPLVGFSDGDQHVFYVAFAPDSKNGASLHELYHDNRGWHIGNPQAAAPSGLEPANYVITERGGVMADWYPYGLTGFWDGTNEHIFAITRNDVHISEFYKGNSSSWSFNALKAANSNGRPSPWVPMTGFYDFKQSVEHVFYIGETSDPNVQHLFELYSFKGSWWPNDLTATGAPEPAGNGGSGGLMSFTDGTVEHVFYSTLDGRVIEMAHQAAGGPWTNSTLPVSTRAWALTGFQDGRFQHVFFMGFDGHVHEMYRAGAAGRWQTNDLTKLTGSPSVACGITSFFDGVVEHVFYVGEDLHVHEIYYNGAWYHNDLTRVTDAQGAPNAQACSDPNGSSQ